MAMIQSLRDIIRGQKNYDSTLYKRIFVFVENFPPFDFLVSRELVVGQLVYLAQVNFLNRVQTNIPINFRLQKIIHYSDACIMYCQIWQLHLDKNTMNRPLESEPFGFDQEVCNGFPIDSVDFSLFAAQRFASLLYPNQLLVDLVCPEYYQNGVSQNMIMPAIFLFYNQKYFKTNVLLEKLIHLFWNFPVPSNFTSKDFPVYYQINHVIQARTNILRLIAWWVEFYRDDLDTLLVDTLIDFMQQIDQQGFSSWREIITEKIKRTPPTYHIHSFSSLKIKLNQSDKDVNTFKLIPPMFSLYLGGEAFPKSLQMQQIEYNQIRQIINLTIPLENLNKMHGTTLEEAAPYTIAQILNYFTYEVYANIHPREFIGSPHSKPETRYLCPFICQLIKRTNQINQIIAEEVIKATQQNKKKGVLVYQKYLETAILLKEMKNYDAAMAVINALSWAPVERLEPHLLLKGAHLEQDKQMKHIFGLGDNWKTIRKELESFQSDQFCVPVLNITLKDVFMAEEGAPTFEDKKINLARALLVWRAAHSYLRFQAAPNTSLYFNQKLYNQLCEYAENEKHIWDLSYQAKPK